MQRRERPQNGSELRHRPPSVPGPVPVPVPALALAPLIVVVVVPPAGGGHLPASNHPPPAHPHSMTDGTKKTLVFRFAASVRSTSSEKGVFRFERRRGRGR